MDKRSWNQSSGWLGRHDPALLSRCVAAESGRPTISTPVVGGNRYVVGMGAVVGRAGRRDRRFTPACTGPAAERAEEIAPNPQLTVDSCKLTITAEPLFWLLKWITPSLATGGFKDHLFSYHPRSNWRSAGRETSHRSMANMPGWRRTPGSRSCTGDDKQKMKSKMIACTRRRRSIRWEAVYRFWYRFRCSSPCTKARKAQLRQAPFMFWIRDMSIPDPYYVPLLIMGVTMFAQQKLSPAPPDPIQAKVMMALPIVFHVHVPVVPVRLRVVLGGEQCCPSPNRAHTKRVESGADAAALKAQQGRSGSGLVRTGKKLLTMFAKQVLPDSKNPGKRKK